MIYCVNNQYFQTLYNSLHNDKSNQKVQDLLMLNPDSGKRMSD